MALFVQGGIKKNANERLYLSALEFSLLNKIQIFQCMGKIFCVGNFEIPHKISYPYIERYDFLNAIESVKAL